ncbi:MAG TPA: hypothetical protein VD841_05175, partial [Arthrobacter sp.]|nr:hypothetical protein [Arthrobacter sp.]
LSEASLARGSLDGAGNRTDKIPDVTPSWAGFKVPRRRGERNDTWRKRGVDVLKHPAVRLVGTWTAWSTPRT